MEKDIGLSREELIEMLKKAEEEKAELTAENSSLRNAVVDSKARIAGYEQSLGALRAEKKKAEKSSGPTETRSISSGKPSRNTSSPTRR